jgi:TolA-binding protein
MQALRGVFGMAPSGGAAAPKKPNAVLARKKQAAQERPHHERLALSVKAQQLQIGQLQEEVDDLNDKIKLSVDANDRASAGAHLLERKRIQTDIEMRKKKLANTRGQLHQIEMANANIEQALLTREGADELNSAVEAMETIDLDGAVDDMQDAAKTVDEHNERLTASLVHLTRAKWTLSLTPLWERACQTRQPRHLLFRRGCLPRQLQRNKKALP